MRYVCPECGVGGADNDKIYRAVGYWCHICTFQTVRMKPAKNAVILTQEEIDQHNAIYTEKQSKDVHR